MPKESKTFQLKGRVIFLATGNFHKFDEARRILAEYNIAAGMLRVKNVEIQSDSLEEIAKASVVDAFNRCHLPVIVEDAGLFVDASEGFSRTVRCLRVQDDKQPWIAEADGEG